MERLTTGAGELDVVVVGALGVGWVTGNPGTVSVGKLTERSAALTACRLTALTLRLARTAPVDASAYILRSCFAAARASVVSARASASNAVARPETVCAYRVGRSSLVSVAAARVSVRAINVTVLAGRRRGTR